MKISRPTKSVRRRARKSLSNTAAALPRQLCSLEFLETRVLLSGNPLAPTGVLAANGSTPTDVEITWNSVANATYYQVWRSTTATSNTAQDIASDVTTTSYDDTKLTTGTNYFYWVVAGNSSGASAYSTIASATAGTMVFGDTFGSQGITSAWGPFNATDPNNGAVIYTNTTPGESSSSNPTTLAVVSDSQATDGQALAMSLTPSPSQSGDYDSAEICTEVDPSGAGNSLEYGEITARIKIPGGNNSGAIWPAFWMLGDDISSVGWPNCGEIDIMENRGSAPGTIDSTIHGPAYGEGDYNGGSGVGSSYTLPGGQNFYSSYHVFTVDWGPNSITYSVDGHTFATLTPSSVSGTGTWVFNGQPFYIILDVCEGGNFAPGTITSTQTMDVDYVRAYSLPAPTGLTASSATSTENAVVNWSPVTGATAYEIWRNSTSSTSTATELNSSFTGTSYTDNTAQSGTNYYYWAVSLNASQTSNFSSAVLTKLASSVSIASPPSNITYDGTTDVTSWAVATVQGASGYPAPTGSATLSYYNGTTATGTPLTSSPTNVGTYTVIANYAGDSNYLPSQSSSVTFTINNTPGVSPGTNAQYSITWASNVPTLNVTQGDVTFTADVSTALVNYALSIQNGAGVLLDSGQHMTQLQLIGNATLDIGSTFVYINHGSSPDPISSIFSWIASGYAGGAWNGPGIISSAAQTNSGYGVGYTDSLDSGNPAGLGANQIEMRYTLYGDANLDDKVNGTDFTLMSNHFNQSVTNGWDQGDFNYDGVVNGADFVLMSDNFNQFAQTPAVQTTGTAQTQQTQSTSTSIDTPAAAPATDLLKDKPKAKRHKRD